jgi:UTP--glucose-1-phosphate uridylyltransferase
MDGLDQSIEKMREEGIADAAIDSFAHYYRLLKEGESGMLPESVIEPLEDVQDAEKLPEPDDPGVLDRTVMIRLNGGLGTSMGMTGPKSLLEVKDGQTFLDLIARQVLVLRERFEARLPLVLMNSFASRDATLRAVRDRWANLETNFLPLDFVQGKVPKLTADELRPVEWPADPALEWAPPGHGDLYTSLLVSGMLAQMLEQGFDYAFVSNVDNLGAVLEPRILAWFAREGLPFAMEVADRTEADRKGGHPAVKDGGLVLRETAQTPEEDLDSLQDTERHRYFNANNLWIDLRALDALLRERDGVLGLPMIVNEKTVDPGDSSSPAVIQLETAMGAAIGVFEGAAAIRVPRKRFTPVKTTNDLLVLRSDAYRLDDDGEVELAAEAVPFVDLDSDYFKLLRDFDERFAAGPPSLVEAERLVVKGDVAFGSDVKVRGSVTVENDGSEQLQIEDGSVLEG